MRRLRNKTTAVGNRLRRLISLSGRDAGLPVTDSFLMEMADDGVLFLKGCRGIVTSGPERIAVTADRFVLTVEGEGLYFARFSGSDAAVGGRIDAIAFGR